MYRSTIIDSGTTVECAYTNDAVYQSYVMHKMSIQRAGILYSSWKIEIPIFGKKEHPKTVAYINSSHEIVERS